MKTPPKDVERKLRRIYWPRLLKSVMMMSNFHLRWPVRKVAFLLLPEFSNLGIAAATEPLFIANWLAQRAVFDWKIISVDGRPVRASNGRPVPVDGDLTSAADCKTVFVLASFDPQRSLRERQVVRWLKRIAKLGVEIGGGGEARRARARRGRLH